MILGLELGVAPDTEAHDGIRFGFLAQHPDHDGMRVGQDLDARPHACRRAFDRLGLVQLVNHVGRLRRGLGQASVDGDGGIEPSRSNRGWRLLGRRRRTRSHQQ